MQLVFHRYTAVAIDVNVGFKERSDGGAFLLLETQAATDDGYGTALKGNTRCLSLGGAVQLECD